MQASNFPLADHLQALNLTAVRAQSVAAYQTLLQGDKFSLIVDDCKRNPRLVIDILNDESLSNNLSFEQFVDLAGLHEGLSQRLLDNPEVYNKLNPNQIAILAQHNEPFLTKVLAQPEFCEKLSSETLLLIGLRHESIATMILTHQNLCTDHKIQLVIKYKSLASQVMSDPVLYHKFDCYKDYLIALGRSDQKKARDIINVYSSSLTLYQIVRLCQPHQDLAREILETKSGNWNEVALSLLGQHNETLAWSILANPACSKKLDGWSIVALVKHHPAIARHVLTVDELYQKIIEGHALEQFCRDHEDIALSVVTNPTRRARLSDFDVAFLSTKHPKVATWLISNPVSLHLLSVMQLKVLCTYDRRYLEQILEDPQLSSKLNSDDLFWVCIYPSITSQKSRDLSQKMEPQYMQSRMDELHCFLAGRAYAKSFAG